MESNDKFTPKGEDKIREEVVADYGLDADNPDNKEFIDKLTSERVENQKKLSTAIQQKIDIRTEKEALESRLNGKTEDPNGTVEKKDPENPINVVTNEQLEARLHREKYPNLSEEEYSSINALATSTGKSFEETIESNPIAKTYFESSESRERLSRVIKTPSTRSTKVETQSEEDRIAAQLSDDLPIGFTAEKE